MYESDSSPITANQPCIHLLPATLDAGSFVSTLTSQLREHSVEIKTFDSFDAWINARQTSATAAANGSDSAAETKTVSSLEEDALLIIGSAGSLSGDGKLAQAAQSSPGTPIVVVGEATVADAMKAVKQGATEVVLPHETSAVAHTAVEAAKAGQKQKQERSYLAELRTRLQSLTEAENSVLDAMLIGMANKQIAQKLQIGLRTVELRRSKIMRKMGAKSLAELVKFICFADDRVAASILHEQQAEESLEPSAT